MPQHTEPQIVREDSEGVARPEAIWVYTAAGGAACIDGMPAARHSADRGTPSHGLARASLRR